MRLARVRRIKYSYTTTVAAVDFGLIVVLQGYEYLFLDFLSHSSLVSLALA